MNYYAGDNYGTGSHYAGDFLGIGKGLKRLARGLVGSIPVVGPIAQSLVPSLGGRQVSTIYPPPGLMRPGQVKEVGISGIAHRAFPGGKTGFGYYNKKGEFIDGRRPRLNPMNVHALRRATRRIDGFVKTARRALTHTPYTLVRRGSGGRAGSPGRITRAEAARALRR